MSPTCWGTGKLPLRHPVVSLCFPSTCPIQTKRKVQIPVCIKQPIIYTKSRSAYGLEHLAAISGGSTMNSRRTVTKKELILRIAEQTTQKQTITRDVIQMFIDEVIQELARGNRLELRDFGVFEVKVRKARKARNPKTGAEVRVPEKRVVTIKPGKKMKEEINRYAEAELAAELAAGASAVSGAVAPAPLPVEDDDKASS